MSKQEIMLGIKQAIQRGYSLELAKQSFINAGYNLQDVEDSARALTGILSQIQKPQPTQLATQTTKQAQPQKKSKTLIIFLIIILLFLLAGLSVVIIFREKIIEFLTRIF